MKVLHLLASNKYSGAENVVCQIINMFNGEIDMAYCSPYGDIQNTLLEKGIKYFPLNSFNKTTLKSIIDQYKPDVIHAHDVRASLLASKFHKTAKIISHIHGNDKKNMGKLTLKSICYQLKIKHFCKIFWVSNSCLNDYIFKNSIIKKSEILRNIININHLHNLANQDKNIYNFDVCFLGRLNQIKNPLRALEIMKSLIEKNNSIKCAIIGDGNLKSVCKKFIFENNLTKNISLFGFVKNPYKILQSSKVLLMTSVREGTPMAILEALALSVPIVSTKIDGAVELIENENMGYLFNENHEAIDYITKILIKNNKHNFQYLKNFSINYNNIENYKNKILNAYNIQIGEL